MSCIHTVERASGNIYIRPSGYLKTGDKSVGHQHNFDHTTIVFQGSVHVRAILQDGGVVERDFVSPDSFLIKANVIHEITALEDNTVYWCVYSHRNHQGDVIQEYNGWQEAYR